MSSGENYRRLHAARVEWAAADAFCALIASVGNAAQRALPFDCEMPGATATPSREAFTDAIHDLMVWANDRLEAAEQALRDT